MSALDDAQAQVNRRLAMNGADALAQATMAQAAAKVAEVEEQRIANLLVLLDKVAHQNRQSVMDELAARLEFRELF